MKKLSVMIILFSVFIFSGCSSYTCPTYAETPEQNEEQKNPVKGYVAKP